jgi:hypothetical protein
MSKRIDINELKELEELEYEGKFLEPAELYNLSRELYRQLRELFVGKIIVGVIIDDKDNVVYVITASALWPRGTRISVWRGRVVE